MNDRPTVFVVDDDASIRRTLPRAIASSQYQVEVCDSADAFLKKYDGQAPGCVVLDMRMPTMNGLDLQAELLRRQWHLPIIFLTGHGTVEAAAKAMKSGAVYFHEKPIEPPLLIQSIQEALSIDKYRRLLHAKQADVKQKLSTLTKKQRQVLDLVVQGHTSKQIASKLGRSVKTVEVHRSEILSRMGARGVAELMSMVLGANQTLPPAVH